MVTLFRRNTLFYKQFRYLHKSRDISSVPPFNMNTEKKAFLDVLPEVMNSVLTGPMLREVPEVRDWMEKLLEYTMGGGKLGRGLMVSIGYIMFEEPDNFSKETQHSARVLGWCLEMDDYMDVFGDETVTGKTGRDIQEGKCSWLAVTALQHCNDAQSAIFKEYYGSQDPEHMKRNKQRYDDLHLPHLYKQCERTIYYMMV